MKNLSNFDFSASEFEFASFKELLKAIHSSFV